VRLLRFDRPDAPTNEQATAHLRVTVKDPDPCKVGRAFSNATMELALGGYAGLHTTTPPTAESAFGVYRPATVPRSAVQHVVVHAHGTRSMVADPPTADGAGMKGAGLGNERHSRPVGVDERPVRSESEPGTVSGPTRRVPLGTVCGARSGDKGGDANIGVWTRDPAAYPWLRGFLTPDRVREL